MLETQILLLYSTEFPTSIATGHLNHFLLGSNRYDPDMRIIYLTRIRIEKWLNRFYENQYSLIKHSLII